jgi:hypothetical protein
MRFSVLAFSISFAAVVSAGVIDRRAAFTLQNGQEAQALNKQFQSLTADSPCTAGQQACIQGQLAQCVGNKFELSSCAATLQCVVLPLDNKPGTRYVLSRESNIFPPLITVTASRATPLQMLRLVSQPPAHKAA